MHRIGNPETELSKPTRQISRTLKSFKFATDVQFWLDQKQHRTAMQVIAFDRPGLLSRIARALLTCQVRLHNAKIATYGERAEDIFYITTLDDQPLAEETQLQCLRDTIRQALDQE
jgi:[protein-PII] uridylyltransferase